MPVIMSLDNMELQKLNDDTNQLGSGMMRLIDNPDRSAVGCLQLSIDMIDKETKDESNTNSGGMMLLQ